MLEGACWPRGEGVCIHVVWEDWCVRCIILTVILLAGGLGRSWSCGPPELTPGPLLPSGDPGGGRLPGAPHSAPPHPTPPTAATATGVTHTATVCGPPDVVQVPVPATLAGQSVGFTLGGGGGEPCVCPHCGKCLRDKYKVRRHIEDVHTPSSHNHQCSLCHRHYKTRNTLQNHMSIYHRQPRIPRGVATTASPGGPADPHSSSTQVLLNLPPPTTHSSIRGPQNTSSAHLHSRVMLEASPSP